MTRRRLLYGLLLLSAVLACFAGWLVMSSGPRVTRARLEQVKEGMTREEVLRTVGAPPGDYTNGRLPKSNQVYVKIILPIDPAARDKDRPVVESWIAEQLKKRGQSKFTAATAWVPLDEGTRVWDGKQWGCSVNGDTPERADGRIKVLLDGWSPDYAKVVVTLMDEPGSREIAAVEEAKKEKGMPYVAVLIGPPPEKPAAPTDQKK
jgi:hypothetical protein